MSSTALVTGGSGFLALHVIDVLLSKGYTVAATFRSKEKAEPVIANFYKKYPSLAKDQLTYRIIKDIVNKEEFDELFKADKSIKYVIHTAANVSPDEGKSLEDAFLKPARDGTLNVLKSVYENAPQVKNVVITSSFVAILNFDKFGDPTFIHDENTWNPLEWDSPLNNNGLFAYVIAKTIAEKLAWKFVEDKKPNFTLTAVNPPYIFGPQLFDDALAKGSLNQSAEQVHRLTKTTPKDDEKPEQFYQNPSIGVDVRDVALFHVLPLENPKLQGVRELVTSGYASDQQNLNIINENFPELNGKIAKGTPGAVDQLNKAGAFYNADLTLERAGVTLIPIEKTIVDAVQQILDYQKK